MTTTNLDHEPTIRRHRVTVDELIAAVVRRDATYVADVLNPLTRHDLEAVAIILADYADPTEARIDGALRMAAAAFYTAVDDVVSKRRDQPVLDARGVAAYAMHLFGISYPMIGKAINRDHTVAMHGVSRVGSNPRLRHIATAIATELGWVRPRDRTA
jgi:chromosomal replication initiation ATPase DnaA